jgi:hypothetical protein
MYGYGFRPNNRLFSGGGGGSSTLWDGLEAYWTLDNTTDDATGNGHNLTLFNGLTYGSGVINEGLDFDNVNDYATAITLGSAFSAPTSAHSYSAWVYPPTTAGIYDFIIQNGNNGMGTSLVLQQNKVRFVYRGANSVIGGSNDPINTGQWNHVVSTYDGAGNLNIYVNGVLDFSTSISWTDGTGTCNTVIGSYLGTNHYMNGEVDEVGAWTRELTPTEVTELYNGGSALQFS